MLRCTRMEKVRKRRKRESNEDKWRGKVVGGYKVSHRVGSGSYGECYLAVGEGGEVCLKVEDLKYVKPRLALEYKILKSLQRHASSDYRFPKPHHLIECERHNILVQDLLGPSLEDLFQRCDKRFDEYTTLAISPLIIDAIEQVHYAGFIHRDIKPHNFLIGQGSNENNVFIVDFGLSKKYIEGGAHLPFKLGRNLCGTARFVGLNIHRGYTASRRDDMEAIAYMLLYFLRGKLPWQGVSCSSKHSRNAAIHVLKETTLLKELCGGYSPCFQSFVAYTKQLGFTQGIDYDYCRQLFINEFEQRYGPKVDWSRMTWNQRVTTTSTN